MNTIPSLISPPNAPKKKGDKRRYQLDRIPKLILPPSPPAAPKKAEKRKSYDLTPIPLEWDAPSEEARWLAESGHVRTKYLRYDPEDVAMETDCDHLNNLWRWYFPASQPLNFYEECYLQIMRDAILTRLSQL